MYYVYDDISNNIIYTKLSSYTNNVAAYKLRSMCIMQTQMIVIYITKLRKYRLLFYYWLYEFK